MIAVQIADQDGATSLSAGNSVPFARQEKGTELPDRSGLILWPWLDPSENHALKRPGLEFDAHDLLGGARKPRELLPCRNAQLAAARMGFACRVESHQSEIISSPLRWDVDGKGLAELLRNIWHQRWRGYEVASVDLGFLAETRRGNRLPLGVCKPDRKRERFTIGWLSKSSSA